MLSLVSLGIITLVTWLTLVFLSVTDGIEKGWLDKLTALNAPIRIIPTEEYYQSYYYTIDTIATASDYKSKILREKLTSQITDPFNPEIDEEIPTHFQKPLLNEDGKTKDLVKELFSSLEMIAPSFQDFVFKDYEMTGALLRLDIRSNGLYAKTLSQATYVTSFDSTLNVKWVEEDPLIDPDSGIYLPKNFKDAGANIGDRGTLSYQNYQGTSLIEEQVPFIVKGFYDPGLLAIGPKCLIAPFSLVSEITLQTESSPVDPLFGSGIRIRFKKLDEVDHIKKRIETALREKKIDPFFKVISYKEYEFVKNMIQQFKSDRLLFSVVACLILMVAASNIISLLLVTVHEKRGEIGMLQAMGATKKSLFFIFGGLGAFLGTFGALLGTCLATLTLYYFEPLLKIITIFQGYEGLFSGQVPSTLSFNSLLVVLIGTPLLSFLGGLIPAKKAVNLNAMQLLKSL